MGASVATPGHPFEVSGLGGVQHTCSCLALTLSRFFSFPLLSRSASFCVLCLLLSMLVEVSCGVVVRCAAPRHSVSIQKNYLQACVLFFVIILQAHFPRRKHRVPLGRNIDHGSRRVQSHAAA